MFNFSIEKERGGMGSWLCAAIRFVKSSRSGFMIPCCRTFSIRDHDAQFTEIAFLQHYDHGDILVSWIAGVI